jgi:hypothetical protein
MAGRSWMLVTGEHGIWVCSAWAGSCSCQGPGKSETAARTPKLSGQDFPVPVYTTQSRYLSVRLHTALQTLLQLYVFFGPRSAMSLTDHLPRLLQRNSPNQQRWPSSWPRPSWAHPSRLAA